MSKVWFDEFDEDGIYVLPEASAWAQSVSVPIGPCQAVGNYSTTIADPVALTPKPEPKKPCEYSEWVPVDGLTALVGRITDPELGPSTDYDDWRTKESELRRRFQRTRREWPMCRKHDAALSFQAHGTSGPEKTIQAVLRCEVGWAEAAIAEVYEQAKGK